MTDQTIVITRPKGDEASLRDELLALGYRVIHEPLTEIFLRHTERAAVHQALLDEPDAILITSRHGAHALALLTELRDVFLLCVGEATAEAAQTLGFTHVSNTGGTVDRMVDYIMDAYDDDARFLYISGEHARADLGEILGVRGMQVQRIVAYDAVAATALSDTLIEQLRRGQIDAFTFLSPRAAGIFRALAKQSGVEHALPQIDAFCLSAAVAEAAGGSWRKVTAADEPTLASVVTCVDNAYANS